ncbi:hypothetical protein [Steroidobacter sp.]|uniref:hypothetical protein n=1 Tax=Steroidobacter sp. TaxID=1978227 RepID=UPI001A3CF09C|nr:hypothetical protein [Steroidobacter sp.]MBL8265527.1 hypothetical protein [Steroidobacter sp.]
MNSAATDDDLSDEQRGGHRVRFELIFGSLWLAFGLFLLPALIFWVGGAVLGPYGENASLGRFYGDFFGDLADTSGRAWSIALGPVLLMYLLRAIFIGVKADRVQRDQLTEDEPPPRRAPAKKETKQPARRSARVEPRMGE